MKKLLFLLMMSLFTTSLAHSQAKGWRAEGTFGISADEVGEKYGALALETSLSYHFEVFESLYLGPLVGYRKSFMSSGDVEVEGANPDFVPVAASTEIRSGIFRIGGDIGQAYSLDDALEDGMFYRVRAGVGFEGAQWVFTYTLIEPGEELSLTSFNMGWAFYF